MDVNREIEEILESGSATEALLLASSFEAARKREIFLVISECPEASFKALKYIPEAKKNKELVQSACSKPEYARVIVDDLPEYRTQKIFKIAVNNEPYWAKYFQEKYSLSFSWIKPIAKKYKNRPDFSVIS